MAAPIVRELLTTRNYAKWIVWMNAYFLSEGLRGIVVGTELKPEVLEQNRDWEMKNGKALHAIVVSCEDEILSIIRRMDSANGAWIEIWAIMLPYQAWDEIWPFMVPCFSLVIDLQGPSTSAGAGIDNNTWRGKLYEAVVNDVWDAAKLIIDDHPEALTSRVSRDETLLHTAVLHNHVGFVKKLLKLIQREHTEITLCNRGNFTVLHLAIVRRNQLMVMFMLTKNRNLLHLKDKYDRLPITIASLMGDKRMMLYLRAATERYRVDAQCLTDAILEETSVIGCPNYDSVTIAEGAQLLSDAILREDYLSALDLYKCLGLSPFAESEEGLTPLQALAGKPSAYTSGNQLKFWQRWIYKCINVQPHNIEGSISLNGINLRQSHAGNDDGSILTKAANWLREQCLDAAKFMAPRLIRKIYDMKLNNVRVAELLATMSDHIKSLNDWEIDEDIIRNAMETAYRYENVEFLVMMVKYNPTLPWRNIISVQSMLSNAIAYRQERLWANIFILGRGTFCLRFNDFRETDKSLLHEVAKLPPSNRLNKVSGPAMQMQRELQWFKEVETRARNIPLLQRWIYLEIMKARELFTKEHKDLVKEAEKWMKETSTSCMVVTTLIATVMFAAAFTVPGGNDGQKGIPIFLPQTSFLVFIIADALSLFSSTASILMFLSILTSHFAEEYFLESLPKKLIIGLATLFFSIATMMVAFSATIVIVLHDRYKWVAIPISFLASVPVTLFAFLQLPLFVEMVSSTYGPSIFRKANKMEVSVSARPVVLQTGPVHTDSDQTGSYQTSADQTDSVQTSADQTDSVQTSSDQTDPV